MRKEKDVKDSSHGLSLKLRRHGQNLNKHFRKASKFLIKCQIIEPYVSEGTLYGCICPWEIGESADEGAFPIVEDFHDTLEAIWVWSYYAKASKKMIFKPNIDKAWKYVIDNWNRFIGSRQDSENKGLYDCSHVLLAGALYQSAFRDYVHRDKLVQAGDRLKRYLSGLLTTEGRGYYDPFWMAHCLGLAAKALDEKTWLEASNEFVKRTLLKNAKTFQKVTGEPNRVGPGGHDFFSKNANKALAVMSCLAEEAEVRRVLLEKFLPCLPNGFVLRRVDENAWNAHLASSIGKSYSVTKDVRFLRRYFSVMDELETRGLRSSGALPRSPSFERRESWVTFFLAHAYASVF